MIFYTLTNPIKVCLLKPFGRGLCRVETSQLIGKVNRLTGICIVQIFPGGIYEQAFTVLALAPEKCTSVIIPVTGSFLEGLQTVSL